MQFYNASDFIFKKLTSELPKTLYYHGSAHTRDVFSVAGFLAEKEKINPYLTQLILTAASYHDSGFLNCYAGHEEASCHIAEEYLPSFNYTKEEIELICGMIRATRIPQSPQTPLEQIIADADLDYLGRDDYFTISNQLFKELLHTGLINDETEWERLQISFIESHQYFTKTSISLREDKKQSNLEKIKARINKSAL
ncbi:MAG: hypothetical protein B7X86_03790 [Sphingobacteriales bacterium 17-39-43]|uniref:HD domain-containing protein n=1 Tax=Daejeonella sp. TaxID=2805397 RepID=UPI000BD7AA52|nr:HD domain-containing protein [Daejeonella sp.]OYZ32463.1 MAG: hypothetical protein B7Y24_04615 [Sphingobacteriales bacterium 16-39-50]OZA25826.1 MAG: hypothetical protein B7X86_03790 [Sphingobacteriales bacterium 17-39-43]HQT21979.1 HD domain-containing protein [Daejeonella sp.]HQT57286.1 HD domain-containing protein [Daejeonella sp.]